MEAVLGDLENPAPGSGAEFVRNTLRHPIYVHSKLMVVDDDYIVIGSANINQRSMAGERDTEVCVGAFQPDHSISNGLPRGDIHTFRMALWSAHLGGHRVSGVCAGGHQKVLEAVHGRDSGQQ